MNVLVYLIPIALFLGALGLGAFLCTFLHLHEERVGVGLGDQAGADVGGRSRSRNERAECHGTGQGKGELCELFHGYSSHRIEHAA